MAATLRWTEAALEDLGRIIAYIAADSPHYAALAAERVFASVERLIVLPHMGRIVPEYDDERFREIFWKSYRIVYTVHGQEVLILAIVHGARQLDDYRDRDAWPRE